MLRKCFMVMVAGCLAGTSAQAATIDFNKTEGNWNVGTNWNGGAVPGLVDTARVGTTDSGTNTAVVSDVQQVTQLQVARLGLGTVDIEPTGDLTASTRCYIGYYGILGTMRVRGKLSTPELWMGYQGDSRLIQDGGSVHVSSGFDLGRDGGVSYFEQNGGTNTFNTLYVARTHGTRGTYTITNGGLTVAQTLLLGNEISHTGGVAVLNVAGSAFVKTRYLTVGQGHKGVLNVHGGELDAASISVAYGTGEGCMTQTAGTVTFPKMYLSNHGNSTSRVDVTGGALTGGEIIMGSTPVGGTFVQNATLNLYDGVMTLTNKFLMGGLSGGLYAVNQHGGTNQIANNLEIGWAADETSTYTIDGGLLTAGAINVGGTAYKSNTTVLAVAGGEVCANAFNMIPNGDATLKVVLPPSGWKPIQVNGTAYLSDTLSIERASDFWFDPGTVVTVMTYTAKSSGTFFSKTNLLNGLDCRVNVLSNMITLDQLKPSGPPRTVIVIR
ncbi:MAG: hypothetical protein PHR35_04605 [Kiritimatiellae bacterium]|nr:hypothetical protein [Kiritimatiellia bacterium]